ncbi:glycosyltransferase family 2 protein [Trichococcus flocculiformis]|uniref:glycosyltransferase family 2 protein n=1 Tax=Trichococcus flocculiformis TaxID=82803 RepID=UPI003DA362C4
MKIIAYVILHYIDIETTINCVESLLSQQHPNQYIIVVDNGSPNESGKELADRYNGYKGVSVLDTGKNLGFARGNNIGYQYAREKLKAEIIIVANNDVTFCNNIYDELISINKLGFEIILPDIINKVGNHQNPFREKPLSNKMVYFGFLKKGCLAIVYSIPGINKLMLQRFKNKNNSTKSQDKKASTDRQKMLVPHGACVIFGSNWTEKESLSFRNCTFMYGEEEILFEYALIQGYKTIYDEKIKVFHMEDQATKRSISSEVKRAGFLHRNSFRSHFHLMKYRTTRLFRNIM